MNSTSPSTQAPARSRRVAAIVGPALLGAILLTSCGGDDTGATQSTIDLSASSTAFVVRAPATTLPPADTAGADGGVVEGTQEYEVQSGDYPYLLVSRFEVTLDDLLAVNEWGSVNEFPLPGTIILIPPGGKSVDAVLAGTASGDTGGATDAGSGDTPAATIPDAGDNCPPGRHTIVAGDYEGKVANAYDVTLDALRAANASTPGYASFVIGMEIVIPAKSDC